MATTNDDTVATRVRVEAKRRGISQATLAEQAGMTQKAVSRRLTGQVEISVVEADLFARTLGVSVSWLFGETADPAPVLQGV